MLQKQAEKAKFSSDTVVSERLWICACDMSGLGAKCAYSEAIDTGGCSRCAQPESGMQLQRLCSSLS